MQLDVCAGGGKRGAAGEGDYVACVQGELARWRRWRVHGGKRGGEGEGNRRKRVSRRRRLMRGRGYHGEWGTRGGESR